MTAAITNKRPASSSIPAAKRARTSLPATLSQSIDGDSEDEDGVVFTEDMTDEARAKAERKQARTLRNRESAQRSRNQRKAHLTYLESRVAELEAENSSLRAGRDLSPAQSILSLPSSTELPTDFIPGGVTLATVAPPPADLHDYKPSIDIPSGLQAENVALRERISLLENLVKQVVAVSQLGGIQTPTPQISPLLDTKPLDLDWETLIQANTSAPSPTLYSSTSLQPEPSTQIHSEPINLACHPAAGEALFGTDFEFGFGEGQREVGYGSEGSGGFTQDQENLNEEWLSQGIQGQAQDWDEEMKVLLENLEGKAEEDVEVERSVGVVGNIGDEGAQWWSVLA